MRGLSVVVRAMVALCLVCTGLFVAVPGVSATCTNPPGPYQVTIWSDSFFSGPQCNTLGVGSYANAAAMGITNDWASSVRIGYGVRLILFEHASYAGTEATYIADEPELYDMDEQASSAIVQYDQQQPLYRNSSWTFGEDWTEDAQGLANADGYATYITQTGRLMRVMWGYSFAGITCASPGVSCVSIPTELTSLGYNHFGDPDYYNGWVLIPVEDNYGTINTPAVAVFNGTTTPMTFAGWDTFPSQATHAAWVSASSSGYLWSSDGNIQNTNGNRLWYYTMNWGSLCTAGPPNCNFLTGGTYRNLYQRDGTTAVNLQTMQGGDFWSNNLFLSNDGYAGDGLGVRLFDSTGKLQVRSWRYATYGEFMVEVADADIWQDEEVEGLDVRNSTTMDVFVLNDEYNGNDWVYWKQYLTYN